MMAIKPLQSLFWLMVVTLGAVAVYLLSLRVATERNELMRVEMQIRAAKSDIRYLETEFGARASLRQLEVWNAEDFRYSTPTASQYLNGERALASLDGLRPSGSVYVATPVLTARADTMPTSMVSPAAAVKAASPAPAQVREDVGLVRTAQAAERKEDVAPAKGTEERRPTEKPNAVAKKAARMAMLEDKLLDDSTLGELTRRAASEKRKVQ